MIITKTLTIQDDGDEEQAMFVDPQAVPWEPVEGEHADREPIQDVTVTVDGQTWRQELGSAIEVTVQIAPVMEGKDNGAH